MVVWVEIIDFGPRRPYVVDIKPANPNAPKRHSKMSGALANSTALKMKFEIPNATNTNKIEFRG